MQQRQGRPPRRCRGRDARSASRCVAGSPTLPSHKRAGTRMLRIPQRGSPATGDSVRRPEAYAVQREPVFRVCSGVGGGRSRRDRPGRRPTGRVARWRCPTCASCCAGREPVGSSTIRRSSRPVGDRSSEKQEAPEEAPPHQRRWLIALPRVSVAPHATVDKERIAKKAGPGASLLMVKSARGAPYEPAREILPQPKLLGLRKTR